MAHSTSATKEDWEIFEVCFDNFERLPFERGEYVESAKFTSFGHQWCLAIYPGGEVFSGDGRVSIYLYHKSKGDIEIDSSLMIKSSIEQTHKYDDKDDEEELIAALQITGVKPEIFHFVLYYTYGGKISEDDMKANARDIIDAANRYGVVNLKLEAEASYVNSTTITVSNLMNQLHYAVSKNCALLQEAVMDYILENGSEVLKGITFDEIPGGSSLFVDLIAG